MGKQLIEEQAQGGDCNDTCQIEQNLHSIVSLCKVMRTAFSHHYDERIVNAEHDEGRTCEQVRLKAVPCAEVSQQEQSRYVGNERHAVNL